MKKFLLPLLFAFILTSVSAFSQTIDYDKLAPHPRLLINKDDITAMRAFRDRSDNARYVNDMIVNEATRFLSTSSAVRKLEGRRLLQVSSEVLKRVFYLSYAYVMTDDVRYAERAEREMLAASEFVDWNPSHFLDVSEMTMALAIGYDWLYHYLSEESRNKIATAIYEKGLRPSENDKWAWFFKADHNWNQVCNAGMIYGALAIMDRSPEYCQKLIEKCLKSNPIAQICYEPDGGYPEGAGYWDYGTSFEVMLVAALQSALGTDAGIAAQESFMRTASYMTYMATPSGKSYNFADSGSAMSCISSKYWFARQLNDASIVAVDELFVKNRKVLNVRLLPTYMVFGSALDFSKSQLPDNTWVNHGATPVFVYRSGWESSDDTYFAIKGGSASTNHAHMDVGSFIYERDGIRWAIDLGSHNYHVLEEAGLDHGNTKQESVRWQIFRTGPESHNILMFNGHLHNVKGLAEIIKTFDTPRRKGAVVNLTPAFEADAKEVIRTAELDKNDDLTITDHIVCGEEPATIEWRMATNAEAKILSPNTIMLKQDGKTLYLKFKGKVKAEAKIWPDHNYREYETVDKNLRRVGFVLQLKANQSVDIEVTMSGARNSA